jgi:hypothetical protein
MMEGGLGAYFFLGALFRGGGAFALWKLHELCGEMDMLRTRTGTFETRII